MVVRICAFLRLNADKSLLEDMVNSYQTRDRLELYSDVAFALKRLKGMGLKIAVVTSTPRFLFENAIVPIKKYVDVVVTSWEAKAVKPEPKIFRKALERLQVKPENVVVIGDSETLDIQPAKRLGMTTVLVDRRGKIRRHSADFKVRSLTHVVKLFHSEVALNHKDKYSGI
jgi:putative hydrolase of the HAD superfamily